MKYVRSGLLSLCQELLFFREIVERYAPTISRIVRVSGELDAEAFIAAAQEVIVLHEPLRSLYPGLPISVSEYRRAHSARQVAGYEQVATWLGYYQ